MQFMNGPKVQAPLIPIDECKQRFENYRKLTDNKQICAGGIVGKDSCSGDSGGPLIASSTNELRSAKYLYGIVSFGTRRCGKVLI